MEIAVLMFSMEIYGEISMEIDVLILHGIPWRFFTGVLSETNTFRGF